jgi:phosphatidylserine/phosphatidylglycerophosphate/cardiolipin synthase-like enzyme
MEIYFENIREKIIEEIGKAKFNVFAAVAWIEETFIINELTDCLSKGVQVELIINDDVRFKNNKNKLIDFENKGGKIFLYDTNSSLMHNKYCVIDLCTTLTGSFNWSYGALFHQENIVIERDNIVVAHKFALQFNKLKQNSTLFSNDKAGNVELAHKVEVASYTSFNDRIEGKGAHVLLKEGKKYGILTLKTDFEVDPLFIVGPIYGFWMSKLTIKQYGEEEDMEFYEFVCTDPYYIQFVK